VRSRDRQSEASRDDLHAIQHLDNCTKALKSMSLHWQVIPRGPTGRLEGAGEESAGPARSKKGWRPTARKELFEMARKQYRVNVYENQHGLFLNGDVVARVCYNSCLDYWDGRNWTNGGTGRHKGITKLKDGRYVIIIGTDWQGERDYAYVVDADEALQEILKSGNTELLDTKKFAELKKLYEQMIQEEEEEVD